MIEYITCPQGDWVVLKIKGETYYEGHSIPDHVWLGILEDNKIKIKETEISDEQMETGDY